MTNRQRLILLLVACAVCVALGVYYLIPGINHVLTFNGHPMDTQLKHALLFFGLAVIGLIASRFVVSSKTTKARY